MLRLHVARLTCTIRCSRLFYEHHNRQSRQNGGWTRMTMACLVEDILEILILYRAKTLFSREENFAKSEFEIISREEILSRINCSHENSFPRKYLPAQISSREKIPSRKYLPAKISSRENIFLFAVCCPVNGDTGSRPKLTLYLEFASDGRNHCIIPTISNLDRSYF